MSIYKQVRWLTVAMSMVIVAMNAGRAPAQEVIEVVDGVYVAVGYGLANSILIEGDDGAIVVDTMESRRAAEAVKAEFDKITDKPIVAIIYTHNHYDHVMGAAVFADEGTEIYAHEALMPAIERSQKVLRNAMMARNVRQFGILLPESMHRGAGIGPRLVLDDFGAASQFLPPTKTVGDGRTRLNIAGVELELVHAPGETPDQLYVWLPKQRALLCGDNYYLAFPNLYAIRGTPYRDPRSWADSLDIMIAEEPEYLIPSHTDPIRGKEAVREVLTDYRDAIRSVIDQTFAGMNAGLGVEEIVDSVRLPEHLASKPYLQETYGTVPWSVRAICTGSLGWFDGNPTRLFPLSQVDRAEHMVKLAGGEEALLKQVREALDKGDAQWAAELADNLIVLAKEPGEAHALKAKALIALAAQQTSMNARNYYLSSARDLERAVRISDAKGASGN